MILNKPPNKENLKSPLFSDFFKKHAKALRNYLLYKFGNEDHAEDMTQEIFLKIIEKPYLFDTKRVFSTWIYTLASNLCKNEYRRKKLILSPDFAPGILIESGDSLPEHLDELLLNQHLQSAIDGLEVLFRQCIVLRYQEGFSIAQISEMIDCPAGTVKSRLHYGIKKLITQMEVWKTATYE